jgi:tetratricopeptide (TPR) repeat protein
MADLARRSGRFEEAEKYVEQCTAHAGYRFNYAVMLAKQHKYEQALAQLDAYLSDDPGNLTYRDQKAKILREMGRFSESLAIRRQLTEDYPDSAELWLRYGDHSRGIGAKETCIEAYRQVLRLAPSQSGAYLRLSDLKTYRFTEEEIAQMEAQLLTQGASGDNRANLHFALGKAYGDQKLYAKSFENYAKGNALRRLDMDINPERLTTHRTNCESLFTKEFFAERKGWGSSSRASIFIVGLPRSGSTLLEQILSSHSQIEGLGELGYMDALVVRHLTQATGESNLNLGGFSSSFDLKASLLDVYPRVFGRMNADGFRGMAEDYLRLARAVQKSERPLFSDKALSNFGNIGLIHLMLPHAKIVEIRRHPLDCGWSCFKNYFPGGMGFSYRLTDIGSHYVDYVRLMQHFERALPGRVHRLIYEELVADPETEIRRLFEHLEVPFEEQCLRFYENTRVVRTISSEQVRMPLYQSGVAQWAPYEPWLGPLKEALGPVLEWYPQPPP